MAVPMGTLYALSANPFDTQALYRVFEIKGRDYSKPISLAFKDLKQLEKFVIITSLARKMIKRFLPGPLTLILPAKIPMDKVLGGNKVGIRIPDDKVALKIIEECKFPITATSANLSGGKEPVEVKDVVEEIGDKVDLILDAGKCKYGKPSTVVDVTADEIKMIREGVIGKKELFRV